MKKKWILPVAVVTGILLRCVAVVLVFGAVLSAKGYGISVGRLYMGDSGNYLIDSKEIAMRISDCSADAELFKGYQNGDKVLLIHDIIQLTYPSQTNGYYLLRLAEGEGIYQPKDSVLGKEKLDLEESQTGQAENVHGHISAVDPSWSFSFTWNTYGISSYDSRTGKLIKSSDATDPQKYTTTLILADWQYMKIWELIRSLEIENYPDTYDPHNGQLYSSPSMTLVLSVKSDAGEKTVTAKEIALSYDSKNADGQKFLSVCKGIRDVLTETEEWKSLPEYEFFYD
jgi:hypothetical protein